MIKTIEFELAGQDTFPLDCEADYNFRYEESTVRPPADLPNIIRNFALDVMVPLWIRQIEDACKDMEFNNTPRKWLENARHDYIDTEDY